MFQDEMVDMLMRHSTSAETAKKKFFRVTDNMFQWWLRLPITNLLWRRDYIRFAISLSYLINQLLDAVLAINYVSEGFARNKDSLQSLTVKPKNLVKRLESVCSLVDLYRSEKESRRLLLETIALGRDKFKLGFNWLRKVREPSCPKGGRLHPNPGPHLALAKELSTSYQVLNNVIAIGVADSLGKGLADETSDIDLDIICESIPDEPTRRRLVTSLVDDSSEIRIRSDCGLYSDEFFVHGILVDTRYWPYSRWTKLIETPKITSYWDEEALSHLDSMQPMWDPSSVISLNQARLRETTASTRKTRTLACMEQFSSSLDALKCQVEQKVSKYEFLCAMTDNLSILFKILAALNDRWIVFPKWARQWTGDLSKTIPDFCVRIENVILEELPKNERGKIAQTINGISEDVSNLVHNINGTDRPNP